MITHEKATPDSIDDYFQKKFHPLNPLFVIGRSYAMEPKCHPEHTVYDVWKELVRQRRVILSSSLFGIVLVLRLQTFHVGDSTILRFANKFLVGETSNFCHFDSTVIKESRLLA